GLQGAADKDRSGIVTLAELFDYVSEQVKDCARNNRERLQTPVLLPSGKEALARAAAINLVSVHPQEKAEAPGKPLANVTLYLIGAAWKKYDQLRGTVPAPYVTSPHLWRVYEATLLRYEQMVRAGEDEHAASLHGRLDELQGKLEEQRQLPPT